jgi:hypothetical protein
MRMTMHSGRACLGLLASALISAAAFGQSDVVENGGPLSGPPPLNAPFTADALTTVMQRLPDGSRIERKMTAHYYRDAAGRVRVEQAPPAKPSADVRIIVFPDPASSGGYLLEPSSRHARILTRSIEDVAVGGGKHFAVRIGAVDFINFDRSPAAHLESIGPPLTDTVSDEALGSRQISGVETIGRRVTRVVPVGVLGNDEPIKLVDERWASPELKLLIYSRFSNSRTAAVEYLVTNIRRLEPSASLFEVPADYTLWTVIDTQNPLERFFPSENRGAQAR